MGRTISCHRYQHGPPLYSPVLLARIGLLLSRRRPHPTYPCPTGPTSLLAIPYVIGVCLSSVYARGTGGSNVSSNRQPRWHNPGIPIEPIRATFYRPVPLPLPLVSLL